MPTTSSIYRHDRPVPHGSDSRHRALLDSLGLACVAVDIDFRILYCNPSYAELVGMAVAELTGRCLLTDLPGFAGSACHRACLRTFQTRMPQEVEEAVNGRYLLARAYPAPEGVLVVIDDVTARRQLEEDLVEIALRGQRVLEQAYRMQRLGSLGLLAGGLAHDFNNLLTGVLGTAEVLLRDLPADAPHRPLVEMVKRAGEQAAELTRQVLIYAGQGTDAPGPLDLNALIRDNRPLLAVAARKGIRVETRLAPVLPLVQGDAGQIRQVILNLVLNAADAVRPREGIITLTTGVQDVGADERDLAPGRYVFLEVADDGCGMTPDVLARVFDPFFTTKSEGRGLGLTVVQEIVRAHRGAIRVHSAMGRGTTFRILLPAGEPAPNAASAPPLARRRLVLVVDDEAYVRDVTVRALAAAGVTALAAGSGPEGIELMERHRDEVALVLLNLIMPGLGAADTLTALRRLYPNLKVLLTTGHDQDDARRFCEEWKLAGFLHKPYTLEELFGKVRAALGAG